MRGNFRPRPENDDGLAGLCDFLGQKWVSEIATLKREMNGNDHAPVNVGYTSLYLANM